MTLPKLLLVARILWVTEKALVGRLVAEKGNLAMSYRCSYRKVRFLCC